MVITTLNIITNFCNRETGNNSGIKGAIKSGQYKPCNISTISINLLTVDKLLQLKNSLLIV